MFKFDGKYGNIHIDGISIDIDKINVAELDKCLEKLERKVSEQLKKRGQAHEEQWIDNL